MSNKFKVGDRVAVYDFGNRFLGKIESIISNKIFVRYDDGFLSLTPSKQLRKLKPKKKKITHEAWVNLYPNGVFCAYGTKENADRGAAPGRIECRRITWESEE